MSDLVVAGFRDEHTAYLARAALARTGQDLQLEGRDIAVVVREAQDGATIREVISTGDSRAADEAFWKLLVSSLFAMGGGDGDGERASGLAAIGIDGEFVHGVDRAVPVGTLAIITLVEAEAREKVLGVLRGFGATAQRCRLVGDGRGQWIAALTSDRPARGNGQGT